MKYSNKLFNIFQRLHSNEYEGVGAGLAIVKKIIQKHSGKVWIESKKDTGTKVSFSLPLKGTS
jgi:light-regulated signal transduction histidine kinase (bacteriophytochrome)